MQPSSRKRESHVTCALAGHRAPVTTHKEALPHTHVERSDDAAVGRVGDEQGEGVQAGAQRSVVELVVPKVPQEGSYGSRAAAEKPPKEPQEQPRKAERIQAAEGEEGE